MKITKRFFFQTFLSIFIVGGGLVVVNQFTDNVIPTAQANFYPAEIYNTSSTLSADQNTLNIRTDGYGACLNTIDPNNFCAGTEYVDISVNFDIQRIVNNVYAGDQWSGYAYYPEQTTRWSFPGLPGMSPEQVSPAGFTGVIDTSSWPTGLYRFCATVEGSVTALWPNDAYERQSLCSPAFTITRNESFSFICGIVSTTVPRGSVVQFPLSASVTSGYNSEVSVSMSATPTGPLMSPSPVLLNASNSYQNIGLVNTANLNPDSYLLTFMATDGSTTQQCISNLIVTDTTGSIDLRFNDSNGPTTPTPPNGSTGRLTWVPSGDVASCIPSMVQGVSSDWTGTSPRPSSGTQNITGLEQGTTYIFKIDCVTSSGSPIDPDQVEVTVGIAPEPPTATLLCEGINTKTPIPGPCDVIYGSFGVLTWSSEYTTECQITPGTWGSATSGSGSTSNLTSNTTYTLTCEGTNGSTATSSVQINVVANPDYEFTIIPTSDVKAQGQTSTVNLLVTNPTQGFNSPVVMSVMNVAPPSLPLSQIEITQNPVNAPYNSSAIAEIDTTGVPVGNYVIIFRSNAGTTTDPKTRVMQLRVTGASAPTAPVSVNANAGACSEIEVTWNPGVGHNSSIEYRVYRSINGTDWGSPIHTVQNNGQASYTFNDVGLNAGTYYYRVSASVGSGGAPSYSSTAGPVIVTSCAPSLEGSYKRVLGSGASVPSHSSCGSPNSIPLPNGNVYVSGQTVFFEICVRNSGNESLSNVLVTELYTGDQNLENVQLVRSSGSCATGSGSGPYTVGNLAGGGVCSLVVSARISNPGGPASTLHRFVNFANISSSTISRAVNTLPEVFSIGAGIPDRVETTP